MNFNQNKRQIFHMLMGLALVWLFCIAQSLQAARIENSDWVIDKHALLSESIADRVTFSLENIAQNRNIHIRVFVINTKLDEPIHVTAQNLVQEWEKAHFLEEKQPTQKAYLVINAAIGESEIVLGNDVIRTEYFWEGLDNIRQKILLPRLAQNDLDRAVQEAAIGLRVVLEL